MFVTPRLAITAAVASLVAVLVSPAEAAAVVVADVLVLAAVVLDVTRAPKPSAMRVGRDAPEVCGVGRSAPIVVRLHNPSSRRTRVWLRDASPPSLHRVPVRHETVLPAGGWVTLPSSVVPARRGVLPLGPVTLRAAGPLGLAGRQQTLPLHARVKVYPPLPGRAEVALRIERARLLQSGQRSTSVRGGGTDFDSLREYHQDDEFRRINWRATARAAKPISNVYREERNQHMILLLDAGRMMAATVEGVARFEHAMDAAVAAAELAANVGDHVGTVVFGRSVIGAIRPRGGRAQPRRILDAIFAVTPTLDAANYRDAFAWTLARDRRRALLVLFTELAGEASIDSLLQAIPALIARHLVIVASVRDPMIEQSAMAPAISEEVVYEKAAAAGAMAMRDRAATRLRRMGVVVVDAPPGRLAGRVADEYVRIKSFGRL